jgi:hypothetical protein
LSSEQLRQIFSRFVQQYGFVLCYEGSPSITNCLHDISGEISEILIQLEKIKSNIEYGLNVFGSSCLGLFERFPDGR